jgi:dihydroflavonol-4-reductase
LKVLITGANGFLGSWLTRRLVNDGHQVSILIRTRSDLSEIADLKIEKLAGDVTDLASLLKATQDIDTVFHLAGVVAYKAAQRPLMEQVNVQGTAHVVTACLQNKVRRLVYLSSVVAVGLSFDGQPLNEESPYTISKLNLGYFETKHKAEQIVFKAVQTSGLDAVAVNPSTIYGRGDAKKGSRSMQIKVAQGRLPFYTSGGVSIVAVEDVIDGILAAWSKGQRGQRYILAGENILIKDLFALIANEAGVKPPSLYLPNGIVKSLGALGDKLEKFGLKGPLSSENAWTATTFHWFDSAKAKRELGFDARPAREAIQQSVSWMKETGLLD